MSQLALSGLFEYLCYGSTERVNNFLSIKTYFISLNVIRLVYIGMKFANPVIHQRLLETIHR